MIVLSCHKLVKDFTVAGKQTRVIKGISCDFGQGEFVSIMGPSGSGKSTFMYLLSGIEKKTSGSVQILGKEIDKFSTKEMSKLRSSDISFIFQAYNLIPNFTVYENVITPLLIGKKKVNEQLVDSVLESLGVLKYKKSPVTMLSGGEQQRVAIARALVTRPKILFADEATGNLDSKTVVAVMRILQQINKQYGITIIHVTHSEECARYGKRILRVLDGNIIKDELVTQRL